jgi:flagellar export protein FliJ
MKGLDTLIRAHRRRLEEKLRHLRELEALSASLASDLTGLEREFSNEQEVVRRSMEAGFTYGDYAVSVENRRVRLGQSIAGVENKIGKAREQVAEIYGELKRYEITLDHQQRREREAYRQREQAEMDEVGIQRFQRG